MDPLPLSEIAELCGGQLHGDGAIRVARISKDTRSIEPGDLYLALRGDNFDGNDFVAAAAGRAAAAAIVDRDPAVAGPAGFPLIRVADSLAALHALAAAWRSRLSLRVVGITGSSGKTSTKEFTAAVLSARFRVNKTTGNLNNHFGLPLTILSASQADQAAVWEVGMNHPGEIAPLAALARPDAAILTNIGVGHIEFFENRDGIAAEKAELIRAVHAGGAIIIPAGDDYAGFLAKRAQGRRLIRCGLGAADVRAESIQLAANGAAFTVRAFGESATAHLPATGEHMVRNALLAIAAGIEFGLSLEECVAGLATARLTGGRLELKLIRGIRFLDDTYNANPDSVEAALKTLADLPASGRRIAVLGRMGELGSHALAGYQRVGRAAARAAQTLVAVGPETAPLGEAARAAGLTDLYEAPDPLDAARLLRGIAHEGDVVLVKGSRAARMEQVIGEF
ncbi:MAG: UDP-N-acetylmuramoyl-tripeptide--D-alanyl-D-alanine ligase [Terrimicrobiaceae bacterium]|nr:UDP-N-acetylmuramoyl-tripeptide--D-alanyl-D-alanine ligase [Terrimicrobiaceae bacterium]